MKIPATPGKVQGEVVIVCTAGFCFSVNIGAKMQEKLGQEVNPGFGIQPTENGGNYCC